ncbi:MAG: hypothetical protein LC769_00220 [Chloroflexi bacterium]|nr:hypothetical protein [Chloroflexota bacterium]
MTTANAFDSSQGYNNILNFTVVAAIVTTVGGVLASFLTNTVFARSLERWKGRQTLYGLYKRYRDPLVVSAVELLDRLNEIHQDYPPPYLIADLDEVPAGLPDDGRRHDLRYHRYKQISTVYRLCAFLGWLELYRQEVAVLDSGRHRANRRLQDYLSKVREDLADERINQPDDGDAWVDGVIYREEQRAIGEAMLCPAVAGGGRTVMGYGTFHTLVEIGATASDAPSTPEALWIATVHRFLCHNGAAHQNDLRVVRFQRLIVHLIDLVEALDAQRITPTMVQWRREHQDRLGERYLAALHHPYASWKARPSPGHKAAR